MRKCEGCDKEFDFTSGKRRFCSRNCQVRTNRKSRGGNKSVLHECDVCREVFIKVSKKHAVCSDKCRTKKYNDIRCKMVKEFREEFPLLTNK